MAASLRPPPPLLLRSPPDGEIGHPLFIGTSGNVATEISRKGRAGPSRREKKDESWPPAGTGLRANYRQTIGHF